MSRISGFGSEFQAALAVSVSFKKIELKADKMEYEIYKIFDDLCLRHSVLSGAVFAINVSATVATAVARGQQLQRQLPSTTIAKRRHRLILSERETYKQTTERRQRGEK